MRDPCVQMDGYLSVNYGRQGYRENTGGGSSSPSEAVVVNEAVTHKQGMKS